MTIKKIKVYNVDELRFEKQNLKEVRAYYQTHKDDFDSIDTFLDVYSISKKYKKFIEKPDYFYMILDDFDNIVSVYDDLKLATKRAKEMDLYKVITFQIIDTLELRKGENE